MEICYGKNARINGLLGWAVRMVKGPSSTITRVLEEDKGLRNEVIKGKMWTGEADGKFCVITDDKEAAHRIEKLFGRTNQRFRGSRIILFSTPKPVQIFYEEGLITDRDAVWTLAESGDSGEYSGSGDTDL